MKWLAAVILVVSVGVASGSELVYTPVNPSFGGSPLNGAFLLNSADAQNKFKDPNATSLSRDPIETFRDTLTRRALTEIANRIVDTAFGNDATLTTGGHYQFGTYTVDVITADANSLTVSIADSATGRTTTVEVPAFAELSR